MRPKFISDMPEPAEGFLSLAEGGGDPNFWPLAGNGVEPGPANLALETSPTAALPSQDILSIGGQHVSDDGIVIRAQEGNITFPQEGNIAAPTSDTAPDAAAPEDGGGLATAAISLASPSSAPAVLMNLEAGFAALHFNAGSGYGGAIELLMHTDSQIALGSPMATTLAGGGDSAAAAALADPATSAAVPAGSAHLADLSSGAITSAGIGPHGATGAQLQQALNESGLSVNGAGIKVGVISDSFNDLGGAAADEADGALPSASNIQILEDAPSGGSDEGRAMMQIIHDIAPGASLAFYTASESEQDFANGILALAAAGCKVICDDVGYLDEPFFQNGVVARAIETVEAEGVTYVSAAGNEGSNGYQAAWTPISGTFDGRILTDAESFGGSLVQTITINTEGTGDDVPLVLEWNQAYGAATSNLEILVFHNGSLIGTATNQTSGEPTNPWVGFDFTATGTYQVAIENLSGPDPGLIKEITLGDGLPATISGANTGTVVGHAMTPGVITAGAVSAADTPAFGFSPALSESFSSSGAGAELLFADNGAALSSPQLLSPVAVSGIDDISTTVPGGLSDFFGTSAASASLAGVAALMLSANPNLTPAQVEQIMEQTAAPMANSAVSGAGLVQVDPAVAAAAALIQIVVEAFGSTSLVQAGGDYFLDAVGGSSGPELKFGGSPVVVGQAAPWSPIAAEQTAGGYDVAWHEAGTDQYSVWSTDSGGNFLSNLTGAVSGTSAAFEAFESIFQQDLNGDGVISSSASVTIEAMGSTSLVQVGSNYFLDAISSGTGPSLKFGGAAVVVGQAAPWSPIGVEQTAGGYDVAWHEAGTDQYSVWSTDSSGNFVSNLTGAVSGTSAAFEAFEAIFHQDLNGDGITGLGSPPASVTIEAMGSTSLVQAGGNYFLDSITSGTGPSLKFGGAAVAVGQAAPWSPIGAEQTAGGYDVAWHEAGTDQYSVWDTDSAGNFVSNLTGAVSGTSITLESFETIFQQDLNGDGVTGIAPGSGVVQSGAVPSGPTSLAAAITVANSDTFIFALRAGDTAGPGTATHRGGNQPGDFMHEAQTNEARALFQLAHDGYNTGLPLGDHDSQPGANVVHTDPHAGHFIVG